MIYRSLSIGLISLSLFACSTPDIKPRVPMPNDNELPKGHQGGHQKVGDPYVIAGKWYYPKHEPVYDEVGYASWYGPQFHGKKTANGETFNMNALTAAHKTLAMPTFVKVTNLENGRSVVLRVNDRGPYVGNRLIDVSRRAAQLLGFDAKGLTRVRVQAVNEDGTIPGDTPKTAQKSPYTPDMKIRVGDTAHYVQIGAYSDVSNANREIDKAKAIGLSPQTTQVAVRGRTIHRVRLGPFKAREIADRVLRKLVDYGFFEAKVLSEQVK